MSSIALLDECIAYFKNNIGFKRPLMKLREKYRSLGVLGGTITLDKLTQQEKEALGGFLKRSYTNQKSTTIKVEAFERALLGTRFEELKLIDIVEGYFNEKLISKKNERSLYEEERAAFFKEAIEGSLVLSFSSWLTTALEAKAFGYQVMAKAYDEDKERLRFDLTLMSKALEALPCHHSQKERLALFSSNVSKYPHSFDEGTLCHKLLIYALMVLFKQTYPANAEELAELLYRAGIIKDDISNYTHCFGLLAYTAGELHPGWGGFVNRLEPMQATLWNLSRVDSIIGYSKHIFVVENPTVFSGIIDALGDAKASLVCTNGQVKLASLILLDKLAEKGAQIYYSGDYDPEGLTIADRLKSRYQQQLTLWRYQKSDYLKALSNEVISESRMKKLNQLKAEILCSLAVEIRESKRAGYQELLIQQLAEDIINKEKDMKCYE